LELSHVQVDALRLVALASEREDRPEELQPQALAGQVGT